MLSLLAGSGLDETWLREHPGRLAATTVDEVPQRRPACWRRRRSPAWCWATWTPWHGLQALGSVEGP